MEGTHAASPPGLSLPAELTIYTATETHTQWLAWLADVGASGCEAVDILAHDVTEVDGAGVQMLVSLQCTLASRGCRPRLVGAPSVLRRAADALGLAAWVGTTGPDSGACA